MAQQRIPGLRVMLILFLGNFTLSPCPGIGIGIGINAVQAFAFEGGSRANRQEQMRSRSRGGLKTHNDMMLRQCIDRDHCSSSLYASAPRLSTKMCMTSIEFPVELSIADYSVPSPDGSAQTSFDHPPVLLLHGLLGSKRNFASLGTSLAQQLDRQRQVLAVDLRNHGDNDDVRHDMSYDIMALDVVNVLDRLSIDKAVLVAHSMGGKVAQTMALLHPDRVAGLVVLDMAPVTYTNDDASWKAVQDIIHVLSELDMSTCISKRDVDLALRSTVPDPALRAFVLTNLDTSNAKDAIMQWKIPMQAIALELTTLAGFEVCSTVQFHGDAFFIHGGQSKFVRNIYLDTIAQYFPNHMLTTIRGAGHWIHAEAPDDVIALLKRYLDR
jgi:esterase